MARMLFLDPQYRRLYTAIGTMELSFENLVIPGAGRQHLITYTAAPGSPSDTALRLLGSATAPMPQETTSAR